MEMYVDDLAQQYLDFADYARGDSPCFEAWAVGVAGDPELQRWIATLPPVKQQPNLVFAAARWHGVAAPGPYDGLRAALLGDDGTIRDTILRRSTQTNEVGRLATLTPVLAQVSREAERPLALVEVGASAGLCLYPDRVGYTWRQDGNTVTLAPPSDATAPALSCEVTGPAPLPDRMPRVSWRGGIDLNPLDVRDATAMAWLENLVWPEQEERRERLRAAVAVARTDPPALVRGDLLTGLAPLVEQATRHGEVVVFHSAVIAYLEEADRRRFAEQMAGLVREGACRWVSNEAPRVLPEVLGTPQSAPPGMFALALDGEQVAWTHGHGHAMTWL